MRKNKLVLLMLLPLVLSIFLSVGLLTAQVDTSVLSMSGKDWSIKVDSTLQTSIDSKAMPTVSVSKAGAEKELFLTLNSLKDCVAGQIVFKVSTAGLTFYKQLPLDKELTIGEQYDFINATHAMLKDKVVVYRPENVVNSFACFDESGKKVLHIYASKLIDAKGNSVWVDSDYKDELLTVYLDQKWLDGAVFPVVVDPTFGLTTVGGSSQGGRSGLCYGSRFQVTEDGTITSISLYVGNADGNARVADYNDLTSSPNALLGESTSNAITGTGWKDFTVSNAVELNEYIWLAWQVSSDNTQLYYDTGGTHFYKTMAYGAFPNPMNEDDASGTRIWSIYATYTTEATPTPTPSPSPSPSPTATPTATPEPTATSPIGTTELVLIAIWLVFTVLAFAIGEPFIFAIAAFISIILGLDLGLIYLGDSGEWIFGIIGFAIMMFGIFQMLIAMTIKGKKGRQR